MQQTTKIYENTTNAPINVLGLGLIRPHDRISVTAEFHTPVNLVNYPGVIDVLAKEAEGVQITAPEGAQPAMPIDNHGLQGNVETEKVEGKAAV